MALMSDIFSLIPNCLESLEINCRLMNLETMEQPVGLRLISSSHPAQVRCAVK